MAATMTRYRNNTSAVGTSGSTMTFVAPWAERLSVRNLLVGALDGNDTTLKCDTCQIDYLGGDTQCGIAELTATFVPAQKIDAKAPGEPLKFRLGYSAESFTIAGKGWVWASGAAVENQNILPVKTLAITDITLYGTIATVALNTYDAYGDTVNSGTFLGAAAGTVLFRTASVRPRAAADGSTVFDVELKLQRRSIEWNKFFNETTGLWEAIKTVSGAAPVYASADFSGLLT